MARGETNWTTGGRTARKQDFTPVPAGDYEAKLNASASAVNKKEEPGKFPYVNASFELMGTATTEGGNNRKVFQNFHCSLKPWKNGAIGPEGADQILGLARAMGEEYQGSLIQCPDAEGNDVDCLDPREVVQWLKDHDGALLTLHVKIDNKDKNYPAKNVITYFHEVEQANAFGTTEEEVEVIEPEVEAAFVPATKRNGTAKPAPKRR